MVWAQPLGPAAPSPQLLPSCVKAIGRGRGGGLSVPGDSLGFTPSRLSGEHLNHPEQRLFFRVFGTSHLWLLLCASSPPRPCHLAAFSRVPSLECSLLTRYLLCPQAKYLAQIIVMGAQVVGRAFARALRQEFAGKALGVLAAPAQVTFSHLWPLTTGPQ